VSEQHINVSARNVVNVTNENAADLFDDITNQSSVKLSSVYHLDDMIQLYRDLPKELFLSRVLSDTNSDERHLKQLRAKLFAELKALEEFPFAPGTDLKRRKNNNRGEGAVMKLCGDIYVLTSILDGAPFDDLKDLISSSKYSSQHDCDHDQSVLVDSNTPLAKSSSSQNCDPELTLLRSLVATIQADVMALKQDNTSLQSNMAQEIQSMKNDIKLLKSESESNLNGLKKSIVECQQSVERLGNEKYNGVSNVKSDVRQIRSDLISIDETLDLRYAELNGKMSSISKFEKRLSKIETKIHKSRISVDKSVQISDSASVCKSLSCDQTKTTCQVNTHDKSVQISDSASVCKSLSCDQTKTTCEVNTHDLTTKLPASGMERPSSESPSSSVRNEHRFPSTLGATRLYKSPGSRLIKRLPDKSTDSCASSGARQGPDLMSFSPSNQTSNCASALSDKSKSDENSQTAVNTTVNEVHEQQSFSCTLNNGFNNLTADTEIEDNRSYSDVAKGISGSTDYSKSTFNENPESRIPVLVSYRHDEKNISHPTRVPIVHNIELQQDIPVSTADTEDDDFVSHIRRRTKRFYVGGFYPSITEA
ncbi:MAG: hypothetical protein AB2693_25375, partial [Candidatus Thiodiazotropha sp.]